MPTTPAVQDFEKWAVRIFAGLVVLSLLTPFWVFAPLLFPYITSKAFYFRILVELALPLYVFLLVVRPSLRPRMKNWLNVAVVVFVGINIITAFTGVYVFRSLWGNFERMGGVFYLLHLTLLFFYVQMLGQAGNIYLKRFLQSFIAVAVLVTLNGLSGWVGGPTVIQDPSLPARVSSTFGNPIFFASYLIVPMFLSVYFALQEQGRNMKITYWLAALLMFVGMYSSATRGAMIGLVIGAFVAAVTYAVLTPNRKTKQYGLGIVALFIVVAGVLFAVGDKLPQGSTLRRLVQLRDSNTQARLVQWKIAWEGFKDRPLLGVGPENYYVVSDKHYDPEMYKYDPSWFDKPHNFLLEVLTTTGIFGFVAYLAMFVLALWALWRSYREELLSLGEMCVLIAALIMYQVQNLFVFDTVSASVAFFAFMGFVSYLWREARSEEESAGGTRFSLATAKGALVLSSIAAVYVLYTLNIQPLQASKRTNLGYAYTDYNPKIAANYFKEALAIPFNLDPRETANKYSDFAAKLVSGAVPNVDADFAGEQLDLATENQTKIAEKVGNDPLLYMRLAIDEMYQALLKKQSIETARGSVEKAIALVPNRVEILQLKIQFDGYKEDWNDAAVIAKRMVEINPSSPKLRWQLAMAYYLSDNIEAAVVAGDEAVRQGFQFTRVQEFAWYIQYYDKKQDYVKVADLLEKAIALETQDLDLYMHLARTYAKLGQSERAMLLANQVAQSDPNRAKEVEDFIKTLP